MGRGLAGRWYFGGFDPSMEFFDKKFLKYPLNFAINT